MSQHTEIFTLPPFNGQLVPPRYTTSERDELSSEIGSGLKRKIVRRDLIASVTIIFYPYIFWPKLKIN